MIGKDEFGNLRLRERRKGGERLCICRYEVIISLWCEELVTDGFCFICEESCKVISCNYETEASTFADSSLLVVARSN